MTFRPSDTQVVKVIKKMRSRYLLPMEMLAFAVLLLLGVRGGLGHGYLNAALALPGNAEPWSWLLSIGATGAAGLLLSCTEWFAGVTWDNGLLRRSVWLRMWLSGTAVVMWAYAVYELLRIHSEWLVMSVVWTAAAVMPFHLWSWWVNFRTHCVLNPKLRTSRLENRLETRHQRF